MITVALMMERPAVNEEWWKTSSPNQELGGKNYKYTVAPLDGQDGGKPGSNIRVAFLYNPDRVKLVEKRSR